MRIEYSAIDPAESKAFQKALEQVAALRRIPANLPIYPYRVPVYRFQVKEVADGKPQLPAKTSAWRYFAGGSSREATVSGDVQLGARIPVINLTYGEVAFQTLNFVVNLPQRNSEDEGIYAPQLIQIPGALVETIRLEPAPGPDNKAKGPQVVPYHSLLPDLSNGRFYPGQDIFTKISGVLKTLPKVVPDPHRKGP
jgi:hypothetical protein